MGVGAAVGGADELATGLGAVDGVALTLTVGVGVGVGVAEVLALAVGVAEVLALTVGVGVGVATGRADAGSPAATPDEQDRTH